MAPLFLIRHAAVVPDMAVPAADWPLAPAGAAAAEALAALPLLDGIAAVYSSPEPKAVATGAPLARRHGLVVGTHPGLAELGRGSANIVGRAAYEAAVAAAFAAPEQSSHGWEPAAAAQRRIDAALREIAARHQEPIAVVSHGLVLSLLVALLEGRSHVDLAAWRALPLPAIAVLDTPRWRLVTPFHAIAADRLR